jgi:hypothetical protein
MAARAVGGLVPSRRESWRLRALENELTILSNIHGLRRDNHPSRVLCLMPMAVAILSPLRFKSRKGNHLQLTPMMVLC